MAGTSPAMTAPADSIILSHRLSVRFGEDSAMTPYSATYPGSFRHSRKDSSERFAPRRVVLRPTCTLMVFDTPIVAEVPRAAGAANPFAPCVFLARVRPEFDLVNKTAKSGAAKSATRLRPVAILDRRSVVAQCRNGMDVHPNNFSPNKVGAYLEIISLGAIRPQHEGSAPNGQRYRRSSHPTLHLVIRKSNVGTTLDRIPRELSLVFSFRQFSASAANWDAKISEHCAFRNINCSSMIEITRICGRVPWFIV